MQDKSLVPDAAIRGWFENVPPNGFTARPDRQAHNDNADGLAAARRDVEIETTPEHRNLVAGDPECVGWRRRIDDPGVAARRSHLRANSGIADLEMVEPHQSERAAELFHRDGFVVVANALTGDRFDALKRATDRIVDQLLEADPDGSVGGGAGGLPILDQEPDEMKLSTLVGVPAGSAVFRDNRASRSWSAQASTTPAGSIESNSWRTSLPAWPMQAHTRPTTGGCAVRRAESV